MEQIKEYRIQLCEITGPVASALSVDYENWNECSLTLSDMATPRSLPQLSVSFQTVPYQLWTLGSDSYPARFASIKTETTAQCHSCWRCSKLHPQHSESTSSSCVVEHGNRSTDKVPQLRVLLYTNSHLPSLDFPSLATATHPATILQARSANVHRERL